MSRARVTDGTDAARWDAYAAASREATPFHTTRWQEVVERTYGCPGYYLAVEEQDRLLGILPLFLCGSRWTGRLLVALPYAAAQPAVCAGDEPAERALVDAAVDLARALRADAVELREDRVRPWGWPVSQTYANFRLALHPDPDRVWRTRVDSRVRTKVRSAQRHGLQVLWGRGERLGDFYTLYAHTMHRLGSPPHARAFFEQICRVFCQETEIVLVLYEDRPAAGALVMHDHRWIGFPWAASRADAHAMRPNNLLYWAIIERACRDGYAWLDLGRSPIGSGPMHFKMQWGAVARPLPYYRYTVRNRSLPEQDAGSPAMIRASQCWRHLPERLSTRLGHRLARLVP
jgi:FemAB-related protein (PEP-CTERM system-associated)